MQSLELLAPGTPVRLGGILDAEPTGAGLLLRRLPAWTRSQITDPILAFTATMPSGGRIELATDTTAIELDVQLTRLAYGDEAPRPAPFDLVVDGELVAAAHGDGGHVLRFPTRSSLDVDFIAGQSVTVRFGGLPPAVKQLQVWLPQTASVELLAVRIDDDVSASVPPIPNRRWVHYGSSISHCVEAERPTDVWPVAAARRAGVDLTSLAIAGQCHLDQFAARTIRDLDADLISLKVGINVVNGDSLRERAFVPAVHGFLDTIRDGDPDTPTVLITPILCPIVEQHPGPTLPDDDGRFRAVPRTPADATGSLTLERIRDLLAGIVSARRDAGDANLHLVSGLELLGPADAGDLYDNLHPTAEAYLRIADRFHALAFAAGGPFA